MKTVLSILILAVILPGMRFDSITPNSGKAGDAVTVTGANFGSDCELTLGRKVAEITELSYGTIKFKVPPHTKGKKSLIITCKERMPIFQHQAFEYTQ